jgi:hypothetical protein
VNLTTSVVVGRSVLQLVDLMAGFLEALRRDLGAESNLPRVKKGEPFEAMVATPANAHSNQRLMTLEAFRRAGFLVHGMMNEPSAAGVEFATRFERSLSARREKVAVFDLGGGHLRRLAGGHGGPAAPRPGQRRAGPAGGATTSTSSSCKRRCAWRGWTSASSR